MLLKPHGSKKGAHIGRESESQAKRTPGFGSRKLAEMFNCGRTQIQKILKEKELILSDYETNAPSSRKRCTHVNIDDAMYQWYGLARDRNIPVTGPMLKEEALLIASQLGNDSFKPSKTHLTLIEPHLCG